MAVDHDGPRRDRFRAEPKPLDPGGLPDYPTIDRLCGQRRKAAFVAVGHQYRREPASPSADEQSAKLAALFLMGDGRLVLFRHVRLR